METPPIAALPSGNTCEDLNQEYFSDDMGDDLIVHLSKISALTRTVPNSAVALIRGTP